MRWYRSPCLWIELFVLANIAFLAPDIYLAHMTNSFRHKAEWLPFYFSLSAPLFLVLGFAAELRHRSTGITSGTTAAEGGTASALWRGLGFLVGWGAVLLGIGGLLLHLESHFFRAQTLDSLVYTAPFAAPLAYTGLGLLLIMNRLVPEQSAEWPCWVIILALGGFVGNFIFSLADHAQNGFYHWTEWIPVAASAFAIGFLMLPFLVKLRRSYVKTCAGVLGIQVAVGVLGFALHNLANLHGVSPRVLDNIIYGAPPLAPLLFPNLALLAFMGVWVLREQLE